MADYVTASPTRRRSIIRDARFPKSSVVAQYDKAREGLVNFLDDGTRNLKHLADMKDHLEKREVRPDATDWLKRDSRSSVEAIVAFQLAYNKLGLAALKCMKPHGRLPLLGIGPTKISVALDLIVLKPNPAGKDRVGGALFLFSKGEASPAKRAERCKTIAGLIYQTCLKNLAGMGDVDPALCLAVDVFSSTAHRAPGSFAKGLKQVQESSQEIADRWKSITPPADYDGPDFS